MTNDTPPHIEFKTNEMNGWTSTKKEAHKNNVRRVRVRCLVLDIIRRHSSSSMVYAAADGQERNTQRHKNTKEEERL